MSCNRTGNRPVLLMLYDTTRTSSPDDSSGWNVGIYANSPEWLPTSGILKTAFGLLHGPSGALAYERSTVLSPKRPLGMETAMKPLPSGFLTTPVSSFTVETTAACFSPEI